MTILIQIPDGRNIACAEYGHPAGYPVFFFHGIPGSRIFRPPDEVTTKMGVRLICTDRPGYGLSPFQPGRRIIDWPGDIATIADKLGIERFAVAGHSGGGPYALACAFGLPDRISAAAVISGIGPIDSASVLDGMDPTNKLGFTVGRWMPWPLWQFSNWIFFRRVARCPESLFPTPDLQTKLNLADKEVLSQPEILAHCRASVQEAFRAGIEGHAWEGRLLTRPWGFALEDIHSAVHVWHGSADQDVPIGMARSLAGKIPACKLNLFDNRGHLLIFPYWDKILEMLIKREE